MAFFDANLTPLGIIASYFQWVDLMMFFIYIPMKDVFGEMRFFMKMGLGGRGVVYLILSFIVAIFPVAIVFGVTFLPSVKTDYSEADAWPIEYRLLHACAVGSYGWTPVMLVAKYTDNFIPDHPIQAVDLTDKKGGRKGMVKNAKPSQRGARFRLRFLCIFGFIIVGYICYHSLCMPLNFFGYGLPYFCAGEEALNYMVAALFFAHSQITLCFGLSVPVDPQAATGKGKKTTEAPQDERSGTLRSETLQGTGVLGGPLLIQSAPEQSSVLMQQPLLSQDALAFQSAYGGTAMPGMAGMGGMGMMLAGPTMFSGQFQQTGT
jgi:hypothetical protein